MPTIVGGWDIGAWANGRVGPTWSVGILCSVSKVCMCEREREEMSGQMGLEGGRASGGDARVLVHIVFQGGGHKGVRT